MSKPWRRRQRRFDCPRNVDTTVCQGLLENVWALQWDQNKKPQVVPPAPYLDHWSKTVRMARDPRLCLNRHEIAVGLVQILHNGRNQDLLVLRDAMQNQFPNNVAHWSITPDQAVSALEFAIQLWLHIFPDFKGNGIPAPMTLDTYIQQNIPVKAPATLNIQGHLSDDFCMKHLRQRSGIAMIWTDDINKHLMLTPRTRSVHIFQHANALQKLVQDPSINPFPAEFTRETLDTLHLLFRPYEPRKARYNKKYMEKHRNTDLELAMHREYALDLNSYRYWHERLRKIQELYDLKKPATLQQWWFDRRDRVQWATFWVAFVVFVLTVVFGVIQSVTGIMQVWIAYHPPPGK